MRTLAITLAALLFAVAAFAQMPKIEGPKITKPEIKIDVPKLPTEDTFISATIVEENGEYYLAGTVLLVKEYSPNMLHLSVAENTAADGGHGTWGSLTTPPYTFGHSTLGKNNFKVKLLRAPTLNYIRLSLSEQTSCTVSPTPHVQKVYELYCVGKQIKE